MNSLEDVVMKNMRKGLLKKLTVHTMIYSLIVGPSVQAQSITQALTGALSQGINSYVKNRQNALAQAQMAQQMARLQPRSVPDKYFNCPVSMAVTTFPEGACSAPPALGNPQAMAQMQSYTKLAQDYDTFFNHLLAGNQNARGVGEVGESCLDTKKKETLAKMDARIANIKALIAQVKENNQFAKEELNKYLNDLKDTAHVLYGNSRESHSTKGKTFKGLFSNECVRVIGENNLVTEAKSVGLVGLRDQVMSNAHQSSVDIVVNDSKHRADIRDQLNSIKDLVNKQGPEIWNSEDRSFLGKGRTAYVGMKEIMDKRKQQFQDEIERIRDTLKDEMGWSLPTLDHNFKYKVENFSKEASAYFSQKYINDCLTGGTALSMESILKGLRQPNVSVSGTRVDDYKMALQNIIESDILPQQKLEAIKKLDKKNGNQIIIDHRDAVSSKQSTMTPYALFQGIIAQCADKMDSDNTYSLNNPNSSSFKEKAQRADAQIKRALTLEKNFSASLYNDLHEELINCSGEPMKAGSCDLENANDYLKPSGSMFCLAHATECGGQISACYNEAENKIKEYEGKRDVAANAYNRKVEEVVANQKVLLDQIKAQVATETGHLAKFFPGTTLEWPDDLFVEVPAPTNVDEFGVKLRGGDDINSLDSYQEKLEKFAEVYRSTRGSLEQNLNEHVDKQIAGMQREQEKWKSLKEQCKAAYTAYAQNVQKANQKTAEDLGKAQDACAHYNSTFNGSARPSCGAAQDLYEKANLASAHLNPAARSEILKLNAVCQSGNTKDRAEEEEEQNDDSNKFEEEPFETFAKKCGINDGELKDGKDVLNRIQKDAIAAIPNEYQGRGYSDIVNFINKPEDIDKLDDNQIRDDDFYRDVLTPLADLYKIQTDGKKVNHYDSENLKHASASNYLKGEYKDAIKGYKVQEKGDEKFYRVKDICQAFLAEKAAKVAVSCYADENGEGQSCANKETNKNYKGNYAKVGRVISSIQDARIKNKKNYGKPDPAELNRSLSRIGQNAGGTPCLAQQGNGNAQGRNSGIDFSAFDQAIFGDGEGSNFIK